MTTEDCTFSVGVIHGGQWVNCVTTTCTGQALSMAKRQQDLDRGVASMLALSASSNDVQSGEHMPDDIPHRFDALVASVAWLTPGPGARVATDGRCGLVAATLWTSGARVTLSAHGHTARAARCFVGNGHGPGSGVSVVGPYACKRSVNWFNSRVKPTPISNLEMFPAAFKRQGGLERLAVATLGLILVGALATLVRRRDELSHVAFTALTLLLVIAQSYRSFVA
jgi:hypothetical protein